MFLLANWHAKVKKCRTGLVRTPEASCSSCFLNVPFTYVNLAHSVSRCWSSRAEMSNQIQCKNKKLGRGSMLWDCFFVFVFVRYAVQIRATKPKNSPSRHMSLRCLFCAAKWSQFWWRVSIDGRNKKINQHHTLLPLSSYLLRHICLAVCRHHPPTHPLTTWSESGWS